ncbi:hypothetical protein [Saccharothrix stipae]
MSNSSPKRRPVNLSLLALILLCLAFPFTAVSCETPMASVDITYTGWDATFGGEPTVTGVDQDKDAPRIAERSAIPAQPLMIVAVLVAVTGLVLLSRSKAGHWLAVGVGAAVAFFLIVGQVSLQDALVSAATESNEFEGGTAAEMVETRFGFWATVLLAVTVTAYNAIGLVRRSRTTPVPPSS